MDHTTKASVVIALVLVVSATTMAPVGEAVQETPADPATDVLGWENGYWYNESIDVDQSDGLNDSELDAYVSRTMARVERLRQLEFRENVSVNVISRETYREQVAGYREPATYSAWNNQVWEALFIVDEPADVSAQFEDFYGGTTLGYYDSAEDELVIVANERGRFVIDNGVLSHELTHALQDQQFDLERPILYGITLDQWYAALGLIEGDALYVDQQYDVRCDMVWDCLVTPPNDAPTSDLSDVNRGLSTVTFQPHSDGSAYVARLLREGGWDAVNVKYDRPPTATEQTIHADRTDEHSAPLRYTDTATNGWRGFGDEGWSPYYSVNGAETVGEAGIFGMFWYQGAEYGNHVIDTESFEWTDPGDVDFFNYTSPPSEGWANDRLFPYRKDGEYGYVWQTRWDTERDARAFLHAYRRVLDGHGAERVDERTWVIPSGGFADAFRIVRRGQTITVVNGPTVADLSDIRPELAAPGTGTSGTSGTTTTRSGL